MANSSKFLCIIALFFSAYFCTDKSTVSNLENKDIDQARILIYALNKFQYCYFQVKNKLDSISTLKCYPIFVPELSYISKDSSYFVFNWVENEKSAYGKYIISHPLEVLYVKNGQVVSSGYENVMFNFSSYKLSRDSLFMEILEHKREEIHPWLLKKRKEIILQMTQLR